MKKLKTLINQLLTLFLFISFAKGLVSCESNKSTQYSQTDSPREVKEVYEGWRLGIQAWTLHKYSFYQALDKVDSLGLKWIEAYPGQQLYSDDTTTRLIHTMTAKLRKELKNKLNEKGISIVNYGVVNMTNDKAECRKIFEFAKEMGIETITAEPLMYAIEMIDTLCQEYQIKLAIHNHPKPSVYWHPDAELRVFRNRSDWIGSCADVGHWMRMNIDPVDALKKLEGRIICLHLKDVDKFGDPDAEDVIFGTGEGKFDEILAELDRQNFKGVFSIEYEANWYNSMSDIHKCIDIFNTKASELAQNK